MQGQVTFIQHKKSRPQNSYGFIRGNNGNRYFFMLNEAKDLVVGDNVQFLPDTTPKGQIATKITRYEK